MVASLNNLGVGGPGSDVLFTRHQAPPALSTEQMIGDPSFLDAAPGYAAVLIAAFLITLIATPIMRRLALANGIVDHPSDDRKLHRKPVAYTGGVAVFLGLMAGILVNYIAVAQTEAIPFDSISERPIDGIFDLTVPPSIILGMFVIMMVGLFDDILHISPRIKVAGQLIAAAALAVNEVAVRVAAGPILKIAELFGVEPRHVLVSVDPDRASELLEFPLRADPSITSSISTDFIETTVASPFKSIYWDIPLLVDVPFLGTHLHFDLIYWVSTAIIAIFVLGACNASNLIDGLDGLLSGVTAIAAGGITVIAIMFASDTNLHNAQQIVLGLAILGACLGFLPYNFKPASIFLGDCGSLLLGFCVIALILMMSGKSGSRTHIMVAGLVVYSIPIMDTILAIVRRKMTGKSMSEPDNEHLHHMLQRRLGVRGAVLALYGIGVVAAITGVLLAKFIESALPMYAVGTLLFAILLGTAFFIGLKKKRKATAHLVAATNGPVD